MNYKSQIDKLPKLFRDGVECGLSAILNYGILNLEKVILFGSCGRLKPNANSDIDFLIVTSDKWVDYDQRSLFRYKIDTAIEHLNLECDIVFYSLDNFINGTSVFDKELKRGIILWEKEVDINGK